MAAKKPIATGTGGSSEIDPATDTLDAKVQVGATDRLLGRYSAGAGAHEEISLGSFLSVSGGVLNISNGSSSTIAGLVSLISVDDTDSSEHNTSTAESSALKTYNLAANDYDYIKIEAIVQTRLEQDVASRSDFTWRIKSGGTTQQTFVQRIIAQSTAGIDSGGRYVDTLSVVIAGGQGSTTALTITVQPSVSNAAIGGLVKAFRVYGVKNATFPAIGSVEVAKAGTLTGTRKRVNFIEGANIAITTTDNSGSDRIDVTIAASGFAASGANTDITSIALNNTGLTVKDTDASHVLAIVPGSNLTANRTLTVTTGDASRTLTLGGDTTLSGGTHSGTNTGDQTITLTGDVTGSGTGSFAATIASGAVTLAKMQNRATQTFIGRNTAGTGAPEELSVATAKTMLGLTGTNSGDQTITLTGDVTGSGTGSFAATIAAAAVSNAKLASMANGTIKGRTTAGTGAPEDLTGAQATALLSAMVGDSGSGGTKGLVPAPASGDAAAGKFLKADGTWSAPAGGGSSPSVISPSQITADQNDYAPTGWADATLVRLSGDSGIRAITGFSAETSGEEKTLVNIGTTPIYLSPQNANSTAANRIEYNEQIFIPPGESCRIAYDGTTSRWRPMNIPAKNYNVVGRATHYDISAGKFPQGLQESIHLEYAGSGGLSEVAASSTLPFNAWTVDNAGAATGDVSLYFMRSVDKFTYSGSTHIVAKCFFTTPTALSNGTQQYRIRHVITASPSSLLTNVNSTLGIRYSHDINSGKFECYARDSGGTETTADSGVTVAAATDYETLIAFNKAQTEAVFFINGVAVARITTNLISSVAVGAAIQFGSLVGTGTKTLYIHRMMAAAIAP